MYRQVHVSFHLNSLIVSYHRVVGLYIHVHVHVHVRYTSLPVYQACALHCIALSRICNPASWAASVAQFLEQGPRNPVVRGLNPT